MKYLASIILSIIYYLIFSILLLLFHPIQQLCKLLGGYMAHKKSVDLLNLLLLKALSILFTKIKFNGFENLPGNTPLIIVANHQSMWDIPPVVWGFRKHHPKFISKIELAKWIPSISYNLKHGGSVLIDRKNKQKAIIEIAKLGKMIEKNKYAACIFPEGTRSKTGIVKQFNGSGLKTLIKESPSAFVIPFVIDSNFKLQQSLFPLPVALKLEYTALEPINPSDFNIDELATYLENKIKKHLSVKI